MCSAISRVRFKSMEQCKPLHEFVTNVLSRSQGLLPRAGCSSGRMCSDAHPLGVPARRLLYARFPPNPRFVKCVWFWSDGCCALSALECITNVSKFSACLVSRACAFVCKLIRIIPALTFRKYLSREVKDFQRPVSAIVCAYMPKQ